MSGKYNKLFITSVASFLVTAVVILLMPLDIKLGLLESQWFDIMLGLLFYASVISGIVSFVLFSKKIKRDIASVDLKRLNIKLSLGLISFCKNIIGTVSDVVFIVGLIGFIITLIFTDGTLYISYILLALTVFGFACHCIFNGKYYYIATNVQRLLRQSHKSSK